MQDKCWSSFYAEFISIISQEIKMIPKSSIKDTKFG